MMELLPLEALLLEYASGTLGAAESLVVAAHVALNPAARKKVSAFETIGGEALRETSPADLCAACLEKVLQEIEQTPAENRPERAVPSWIKETGVPKALYGLIHALCQEDAPCWSRVSRGVEKMDLPLKELCAARGVLRLMRLTPGEATPRHAHTGREITLVLEGGYTDELGHYRKGDVSIVSGRHTAHSPKADPEGCLCLTLTEAPLHFDDLFARFANIFRMV